MSRDIAVFRCSARSVARAGVLTVATLSLLVRPGDRALAQTPANAPSVLATSDTAIGVRIDSVMDLETVIRRTLEVSPAVVAGDQSMRVARSQERVALGAYVPTLSANSAALRSNVSTVPLPGGSDAAYSAGFSSSVDLFTGGRRGADRSRATADYSAAEARDIAQRFAVTLAAQRAFYETLRAGELVDVARARVAQAERSYRYATDRVRAGTTTKSDELRARLELTTGRQQLIAAADTLQASAYSLGRLVGANGPVGANRASVLDPTPLALADSDIVRAAVEASPSVRAARAAEQAGTAATRSARSAYLPGLRVTGGYNWANQTQVIGSVKPGWSVALGTSVPLFNGFQREDAITHADAAAEVARVTALDATREARTEAARLLSALRFAEQNIALAEEGVQSAAEDLRVQSERYQAGISTELDQLTSQLAVTQARLRLVAARFNYLTTRAQLEALIGRTL
jgi:outer membrane protein TolC